MSPRESAFRVLLRREDREQFVENLLDAELNRSRLSSVDRALCTELVFGTVRWERTLNWLIYEKARTGEPKPELKILLRLGLYQLFWLGRIPDHAAVHETVELGKKVGFKSQAAFVNAILRGYTREKNETEKRLDELKIREPALGFSHPDWLVEKWRTRFGDKKTRTLLEWNNLPPYTFARINTLKTDAEKIKAQWQIEGVKFTPKKYDWIDDGLVFQLDSHPPLTDLPSFRDGLFYVQDPSTLLSIHQLSPKTGETILDLCAAPGGKTTFTAQLMQNRGKIIAEDIDPDHLRLVQENCVRLGVTCVHYAASTESTVTREQSRGSAQFDRILIDAPCSNSGVLRRRVDLRWRIQPNEIERLRSTQLKLLRAAASRLKMGGVLAYSTCSLEPEENSAVIKEFLAGNQEFKLESERELLPFAEAADGAYVAQLKAV